MTATVHVVGAGVAGLSCAVRLARAGRHVAVHEAAGQAGGRCRSFHDATLDRLIDNGNHLLMSGNRAVRGYLEDIGSVDSLIGPVPAEYPFLDLQSGLRWVVRPSAGPFPWWIFSAGRRVPDTRPRDYLRGLRLAWAGRETTVAACLGTDGALFRRFWEPLAVAVLNTSAADGAASLMWPMIAQTFGRGEAACRPLVARRGLSDSFIDPALAFLDRNACPARFNHRLRSLRFESDRVAGLDFGGDPVAVAPGDCVVLAVPPAGAAALVPGIVAPATSRAIVNGHFRLATRREDLGFLGLVGGTCQWLFVRGDIASVTVSAADALADEPSAAIAGRCWADVARALGLGDAPLPLHRIVKEKRATFAQTPEEVARRPGTRTAWRNLCLAGDWTDTGLPATIEGAVRSGRAAADAVLATLSST